MKRSVTVCLLSLSMLLATLPLRAQSQIRFPSAEGEQVQYEAYIQLKKGYLSGICVLQREGEEVKGCLFNEFGITALDFSYSLERRNVKLHHVVRMMDRWYIRRVLRKDLAKLMEVLRQGGDSYENTRHHITYRLTPIEGDEER